MVLGNGTTDYTFTSQEYNDDIVNIKSRKITAGGFIKSRTTGDRFTTSEIVRLTGTELSNLMDLINDNSPEYFYTPTITPPEWNDSFFPMSVSVEYKGKTTRAANGGDIIYYITLMIESNEVYNQ